MRVDGRQNHELRPFSIQRDFTKYAQGSVLVSCGDTKVICTASVEEKVPPFLKDSGQGWITAEYSMLPSATQERTNREVNKGKPSGRTQEIQRLIGRALRTAVDLKKLGERTIYIDADVIQADGGTRTASITGGMVALSDLVQSLTRKGKLHQNPIKEWIGAVSVGVINGVPMLDLCYIEDSKADVDMNIIMTESGKFVEIQGTAEASPFSAPQLTEMIGLATGGIQHLISVIKMDIAAPVRI